MEVGTIQKLAAAPTLAGNLKQPLQRRSNQLPFSKLDNHESDGLSQTIVFGRSWLLVTDAHRINQSPLSKIPLEIVFWIHGLYREF